MASQAPPLRRRIQAPASVAGASGAAAGLILLADATGQRIVPPCPFLSLTGHWCPLCGGTRTVESVLSGDLAAAAGYNVVVLALIPLLAGWLTWWGVGALLGRNDGRLPHVSSRVLAAVVGVLALFWVVRNLPGMEILTP